MTVSFRSETAGTGQAALPTNDKQAETSGPARPLRRRIIQVALTGVAALVGVGAAAALVSDFLSTEPKVASAKPADAIERPAASIPEPVRAETPEAVEKPARMPPRQPEPPKKATEKRAAHPEAVPRLLGSDDPRWAKEVEPSRTSSDDTAPKVEDPAEPELAMAETARFGAGANRVASLDITPETLALGAAALAPDRELTAAIPPPQPETEDLDAPAQPTRTARVSTHVNMRAAPKDEADVITVVPAKAAVEIVECDGWCEVIYEGKTGFIYKSFFGQAKAKTRTKAKAKAEAAAPQPASVEERPPATNPQPAPRTFGPTRRDR